MGTDVMGQDEEADRPAWADAAVGARADTAGGREPALSVAVISDVEALEDAAAEWVALERLADSSALFQTHAQITIWARSFLAGTAGGRRLHIALVREAGAIRLIVPVTVTTTAGIRVGRIAGCPIAQYSELLGAPEADLPACFSMALKALRRTGLDLLQLDGVREGSALWRAIAPFHLAPIDPRVAPFADLSHSPDHDAFVRKRSKNLLHGLRNRRKQIERTGALRFDLLEGGQEARAALAEAIQLKREWLVQRGAISTAFLEPITTGCLLELAQSCPGALVMRMLIDEQPAAIRFGFEHAGTYFAYMSAYDTRLAQYAPGKLLLDFCFASIRARGGTRVDMLPPAGEHKAVWCDGEIAVADYTLPLSMRGLAYARIVQERLRPALSWTWHHLPAPLRTFLAARFLTI